jgi:hypothetical protein
LGECISKSNGFTTCAQYCHSLGEACIAAGCSNHTWVGWGVTDACQRGDLPSSNVQDPCDAIFYWQPVATVVRCCCTDTH